MRLGPSEQGEAQNPLIHIVGSFREGRLWPSSELPTIRSNEHVLKDGHDEKRNREYR